MPKPSKVCVPSIRAQAIFKHTHRILDGTVLSRGVTRWSLAAIVALGLPLVYLAACARPQTAKKPSPAADAMAVGRKISAGDFHLGRGEYDDASGTNRPVIVSDEIWYSEQLHINVLKRHSDPRTGQLTVTVTNINVNEPDVELFAIPPDYKFVDMTPPVVESAASVRVAPN